MPISKSQKLYLAKRAGTRCEYCLIHETLSAKSHEADHIIPQKHGGNNSNDNLAWACFHCNRYKGSEVGAFDAETGQLIRLFNPRYDVWSEHFRLSAGELLPITAIPRVTILVLRLNRPQRISVRRLLADAGLYP